MTRFFCDVCGTEMDDSNTPKGGLNNGRVAAEIRIASGGTLKVEIMHSWNGTANAGEVCKYCILDALRKLDDRPTCGKGQK